MKETLIGLTGPDCAGREAVADHLQLRLGMFRLHAAGFEVAVHALHAIRRRQREREEPLAVICSDVLTERVAAWIRAEGGTVVHVVMDRAIESPVDCRIGDRTLCRGETATLDELLARAEGLARGLLEARP